MKAIFISLLLLSTFTSFAQTEIQREFDGAGIKEVIMNFKFPESVKVKSWDGDQILIKGSVMINRGENDNNFELKSDKEPGKLFITSEIKDIDNLPHRIWAREEDGTIHYFNATDWNSPEVQEYLTANPGHQSISNGVIKDIKLEVMIPKNMALNIICKYGLLEIQNFDAPLSANSKYGGIDISFSPNNRGNVEAKTKFGEIYTNLDLDFSGRNVRGTGKNKWLEVQSKLNGGGDSFMLESKYGDLYLRKSESN